MEGQGRRSEADSLGNVASGKPLGAALNQKPKDSKTVLVSQGSECINSGGSLHTQYDITAIIEMSSLPCRCTLACQRKLAEMSAPCRMPKPA